MRSLKYTHSFEVVRDLPEALRPLKTLAYNYWWTWHHETQALFQEVDRDLWEAVGHNPVELINQLSNVRQTRLLHDEVFLGKLAYCAKELEEYMGASTWFDEKFPDRKKDTLVAYFCFEFGIHECLPIYSGGLGVLAGDHLKAASDLGVPLVGVGLLYSRGYFRQYLNPDGWQQERYPQQDFYRTPLRLVRGDDDQPLRVKVDFPDRVVTCQIWKAQVGRVELYLLDSNILENAPNDQTITDSLYGGDQEMRIRQESILGIGGFRALQVLGIKPTVCHMNEGHAAFLTLERLRSFMKENSCDFRTARQCTVSGNVFTTHTPVPAGFDIFEPKLLERYMTKNIQYLGMPFDQFLKLGRIDPENKDEPFNMAVLAMENSNYVNGVSKLHANVTREMFSQRWPDYALQEIPIDSITNGIHTMTWISRRMSTLLDRHVGPAWKQDPSSPEVWERATQIPDSELWETRENERGDFVRYCRRRLRDSMRKNNAGPMDMASINEVLDPRVLTIGFARRFATYKRATLLFHDKERLKRLLNHPERPVQFVFAGKAHPRDEGGKRLIQDIIQFIRNEGARGRMVFLEDYDMEVARHLVQGVDLWLNNPRKPMEASGTSGMKVVPNGGLNLSVLDGWWAEGFKPGVGWPIGDDSNYGDDGYQDWLDSRSLYHMLENEIAPRFYHRTDGGIPLGWVEMMKGSMRQLGPTFSTLRMVREYAARYYVRASQSYTRLSENSLERAKNALVWRDKVRTAWQEVKVQAVSDDAHVVNSVGADFTVRTTISLGSLQPDDLRVQVLIGQVGANRELTNIDLYDLHLVGEDPKGLVFEGTISCRSAGHRGYIVRVVPHHEDVRIPTELSLVAWEYDKA
jgi:starch phosphorylase